MNRAKGLASTETPVEKKRQSAENTTTEQIVIDSGLLQKQTPPLLPVSRSRELPLSFAQERLWLLDRLETGSLSYNIAIATRLTGSLNVPAIEQSLNEIMRRHEALRTSFTVIDGRPIQVIAPALSLTLAIVDLRELPETERETEAMRLATQEQGRPFDLRQAPLLRATLIQLGQETHVLLLTIHQIVFDKGAKKVLFWELEVLYEAFSTGKPSPLPELPIQYVDFAGWQQQWLQSEVFDTQLAYWKQQLNGAPPVLQLPTDRPRPKVQTFQGATQSLVLPQTLCEALKALSQQEGVTLFMMLLAAFKTLLYRYTGQDDILVGTPIANRNQAEIESLIGCFANTLVMRNDLSGNPTFRQLLMRVREVALGAYAHSDLPFEHLLDELQLERDMSRTPLFQVMFDLSQVSKQTTQLQSLKIEDFEVASGIAKFDLTLDIVEQAEGLSCLFEYNTNLFDASTIQRMLGHYQTLLESVITNPEQQVLALPLLTDAERHQMLVEWNKTKISYSKNQCIHQLIEAQVEQTPDALAVVFEDQQLTYRELNARANQLAHFLRKCGVRPEVLVGICMERSLEIVVGILGILKAGGAYVPLDPSYPKERLSFILEETHVPILLTQQRLAESLTTPDGVQAICVDSDCPAILQHSDENLTTEVTEENLAYAIYTSGSTGKPKGVMIEHASLCHYVQSIRVPLGITADDKYLHTASFAFSSSVRQLMVPLSQGAAVAIANFEQRINPLELFNLIKRHDVTVIDIVPSHWRTCTNALASLEPEARNALLDNKLRLIASASEPLLSDLPRKWTFEFGHSARSICMYGQTETTGIVSVYPIPAQDDDRFKVVSIGRPIANTQLYLLDRYLQPVPIGIPGEVYIGGSGLGRGYLNHQLTLEKFIPNPLSADPGVRSACAKHSRLYKTGDLGRYLPDGTIEFLGRLDEQVKIRGMRVEIGEIEAVLSQHPGVRQTVVMMREDVPGERRLVAYIVANQGQEPLTRELRSFLKQKLPEYMVPGAFVLLEALPLTPNGKPYRRALPAPNWEGSDLERTFVASRSLLELQLTKIWEKVLGRKPISVNDNFFELGGSSLLAVQLFTQIEKTFGKNLPLATLFQAPTIEQLALILGQEGWSAPWASLVPMQTGGNKLPLFCIHGAGANVLSYRTLGYYLGEDQPVYALQAQGLDGKQPPYTTVEEMSSHYITEIRTVQPEGPYFLAGYCGGGIIAFEMAQQLQAQGQKVALVAMFETLSPKVLTSEPPPLSYKVFIHWFNLSRIEPFEQLLYLLDKVKLVLKRSTDKLSDKFNLSLRRPFKEAVPQPHQIVEAANKRAFRKYVPQVYPGKVTLFQTIERPAKYYYEPTMGWGALAASGVEIHHVPGHLYNMILEPRVQDLAEKLKACLAEVQP